MKMEKLAHTFQKEVQGKILSHEPMSRHTTWRIGGRADLFFCPLNKEDFKKALIFASTNNLKITIIGAGSNLLVKDGGIRGLVICLRKLNNWKIEDNYLIVESGISLPVASSLAAKESLTGLEFAIGIPGSVGGATLMNAGAHRRQMADVVDSVSVMDYQANTRILTNKELDFSYRSSRLQRKACFIIEVKFKLEKVDSQIVKEKMNAYQEFRRSKQPIDYPNAGSVFKNPTGDSAGRIIDSIGAKGWSVGGAMVSPTHANFIVNTGNARCSDVLELMEKIITKVKEEYKLILEPEIIVLGE